MALGSWATAGAAQISTAIQMPALVLRARQEIMPGFGFILPAAEARRFAAAVPSARLVDRANRYTITTRDDPPADRESRCPAGRKPSLANEAPRISPFTASLLARPEGRFVGLQEPASAASKD